MGRVTRPLWASRSFEAWAARSCSGVWVKISERYREPTSGVFAEALALGKPVVVTSGTWMARELRRSGGGAEFVDGDAADLVAKVVAVVKGYEEYARRAHNFSPEWRRFHNSHTLAELLLKESGLAQEHPGVERGVRARAPSETL